MDGKKVLLAIEIYRNHFRSLDLQKTDFPHEEVLDSQYRMLAHCHGMLDEMEKFVAEGRMEKVFRWLGFIQGCLWSCGHYTLEELKNHNRPDATLNAD